MKPLSILYILPLLLAAHLNSQAQQAAGFPPAPPLESPIKGLIDFHVHSGPDAFGRSVTDLEAARLAVKRGMKGIVLKNHITGSADRAYIVMQSVPDLEVFGGIALNHAVGGVNPDAVEWMQRIEGGRGKVVWFPTFDADYHHQILGAGNPGIKVAMGNEVLPEVERVLQIIAREDLVLHTGHVSPTETMIVLRRAKAIGVKNMVVTHAMASIPGLSLTQMKEAAELGAYHELVYVNHLMGPQAGLDWMKNWKQVSITDMAAAIKDIGAAHFILSSDLGQANNPVTTDGYISFVLGLLDEGISQDQIIEMGYRNSANLLGLE